MAYSKHTWVKGRDEYPPNQLTLLNSLETGVETAASAADTHAALTAAHGATGAVVGTTNSQTLDNKTLTTPTIASFTNATHDHSNAAGGGNIPVTSVTGLVGAITAYAGSTAPTGFLLCYGQAVSRTTYATLYALIGTTYGTGDGSTTFNVPDIRGRVPVGADNMGGSDAGRLTSSNTLGTSSGAETHTLSAAEMPAHTHGATIVDQGSVNASPGWKQSSVNTWTALPSAVSAGSGGAHNNMQPFITLNYIIKY